MLEFPTFLLFSYCSMQMKNVLDKPTSCLTSNVGVANIERMDMKHITLAAGGTAKLAKAVGRHRASVRGWTRVPAEHAAAVSAATGIPRHVLRPDLWEPPEAVQRQETIHD